MTTRRWARDDGAASIVQAALIMPLLAVALGAVLHLGLYLLSRSVTLTAVQEGLTVATADGGSTSQGRDVARQILEDHSAVEILDLSASTTATTITFNVAVRTPGLVPGITRIVTVAQTAAREQWIAS